MVRGLAVILAMFPVYASVNLVMPMALTAFFAINLFADRESYAYAVNSAAVPLVVDVLSFSEPVWLMIFR